MILFYLLYACFVSFDDGEKKHLLKSHCSTNRPGVIRIKPVMTDCSPNAIYLNLDSSLEWSTSIRKSYISDIQCTAIFKYKTDVKGIHFHYPLCFFKFVILDKVEAEIAANSSDKKGLFICKCFGISL